MGRNKVLRREIAGYRSTIEEHEAKIRAELTKTHPNEDYIRGWRREIEIQKTDIERLKREW
jgi:hypothetical protein